MLPHRSAITLRGEIRLGTRASALAMWQAEHVVQKLRAVSADIEPTPEPVSTVGDRDVDAVLSELGGAAFSSDIEQALMEGRVRAAVHSLKDLPIEDRAGICTAAILSREDPRDALISRHDGGLAGLPEGAVVGTSSPRRTAQLRDRRPDLLTTALRGNIETRVSRTVDGSLDAVVLAMAGVNRLGLTDHVSERFPLDDFVPAPGQGALAVQCRDDDEEMRALLAILDDAPLRTEVEAERSFLLALGGGCSLPVGASARHGAGGQLELSGYVGALGVGQSIRITAEGADPAELGHRLAQDALSMGARELLA